MRRIIESVVTIIVIGILGGVVDTFIQVKELKAESSNVISKFEDIKKELTYIRERVDALHAKRK